MNLDTIRVSSIEGATLDCTYDTDLLTVVSITCTNNGCTDPVNASVIYNNIYYEVNVAQGNSANIDIPVNIIPVVIDPDFGPVIQCYISLG